MFLSYHQVDVLGNQLRQDVPDDHRNKIHPDNELLAQAMITKISKNEISSNEIFSYLSFDIIPSSIK
jgi:hypothetical protein